MSTLPFLAESASPMFFVPPSPIQPIQSALFHNLRLWVKRDDLLHPHVSGNKFRKLKYQLLPLQGSKTTLVTMGGAWSNHLHATAHAAKLMGLPCIGLVRGVHHQYPINPTTPVEQSGYFASPTLRDCHALGMQLHYVSREDYRTLRADPLAWRDVVPNANPSMHWLPEGGSAASALTGVAEIIDELPFMPDILATACGTGATLAGLLGGLQGRSHVLGVAVLKNAAYLHDEIANLLHTAEHPAQNNYTLLLDQHHGGYAKCPIVLRDFCKQFSLETGIPIEPVYTGKLFFALHQLAQQAYFSPDQSVLAIHTGGLQGQGFLI